MTASAKSVEQSRDQLDPQRVQDNLTRTLEPANGYESMLVTLMAQAWIRLQRANDLEQRYFNEHDMLEVITTNLKEFNAITRYVRDSERAWRQASAALQKAQRQRKRDEQEQPEAQSASPPQSFAASPVKPATPAPFVATAGLPRRE